MNSNWQSHPIFTRPDNSYIITYNGYPYHVPNPSEPDCEEFADLWAEVDTFAKANPAQVEPESAPTAPTPEEQTAVEKAARIAEIKLALDDIDRKSARPLRAITAGTAPSSGGDDRGTLAELENRATALRTELTTLEGLPSAT